MVQDVSAGQLISDLKRIRELEPGSATSWGRYRSEHHLTEYVIGLNQESRTGTFHRLTGALTSQGLEILSANIHTVDNIIIDRFLVQGPDHEGCPPEHRIAAVCQALSDSLDNPSEQRPIFRRTWKSSAGNSGEQVKLLPTRVVIDNTTLSESTIIDVFAHDRVGLLYTITRTLYEMNLSVNYAKIGTYLDQVVDVFYVTDLEGNKIDDESRLERIQDEVIKAIEGME